MQGRTVLLWCLSVTLSVLGIVAHAQTTVQNIAVLKSHDIEPFNQALAGFLGACGSRMTEHELRGSKDKQRSIVQSVVATRPQLILALGTVAAQIAKEMVQDIPVVFCMVPSPHKYGLEGKNIAGISLDIPIRTQFARYKALLPALKTLGVIYDPAKTGALVTEASGVAEHLGLRLLAAPAASQKDVPGALRSMLGKIEALWMVPDETIVTPESFQFFLLTAFENHLPFLAVSDIFVQVGALASLTPDYTDMGRQGCQLAREMESGQWHQREVNIVPPMKVNLAINLNTASKIGLTLSPEIIQSASKVYR